MLVVYCLELLYDVCFCFLFEGLKKDIVSVLLEMEVVGVEIVICNLWDFEEVYVCLYDFVCSYIFYFEDEDYLIYIIIGIYVVQICWFLLVEVCYFLV